jgi:hypothetical protein
MSGSRRIFLKQVAAAPFGVALAGVSADVAAQAPAGYASLGPDEAAFVERLFQRDLPGRQPDSAPGLGRDLRRNGALPRSFERLFGIAGKAGNIKGEIRPAAIRSRRRAAASIRSCRSRSPRPASSSRLPPRSSATSPSRWPRAIRAALTPIRTECVSRRASTAGTVSASTAKRVPRRARRCCSIRCSWTAAVSSCGFAPMFWASTILWDEKSLDAFIAEPQKAIPVNTMPFGGISDPKQRAEIVDYLKTLP